MIEQVLAQIIIDDNVSPTYRASSSSSAMPIGMVVLAVCFLIGIFVIVLVLFIQKRKRKSYEKRSLEMRVLEVKLPQNNEIEIKVMEQLYASLHGLKKEGKKFHIACKASDFISFEIVAFPETIRFYIVVPLDLKVLVEKQIHGVYSTADIQEVGEYNIFEENGRVACASLIQTTDKYKPLKTYEDLSVDLLSSITNSMSKLEQGEGIALQFVLSPAGDKWRDQGKSFVSNLKKAAADSEKKVPIQEDVVSVIEKKCAKVGFCMDIRVVAVGKTQEIAERYVQNVLASFESLKNQQGNSLVVKKLNNKAKRTFVKQFIYRIPSRDNVFNIEELATIYHFPNKNVETPYIHWLLAKRAPASREVSTKGLWLGKSIYRDVSRDVCIKEEDRRRHMYIIGKTGVGKSFLLQSMIWQDIKAGRGLAFLDPHGDHAEWLLERIPEERAEDVIYFNPADTERPIGFNVIEYYDEQDKHLMVNAFIGLMYKMFDPNRQGIVGPRFERAVRNAMLTVMAERGNTLVEVMRILTDPAFVKKKLPFVKDAIVRRYWTDEIAQTSDFHKSEVLGYIVSKFDRFVTNKLMRNIIGQGKSGFDLRKIMDEGKILIVNLSKGLIGEENSQFLGLLLVPKILSAAMARADTAMGQRRDFYLYVDEFQNFATDKFAQILSEARKYRLNLVVANQYISQMEDRIRDAVFGNVGSILSFKVGVNDAQYLQNEFAPVFDQNDLVNLEAINAYVKLLVDGECPSPFSVYTHLKNTPFVLPPADLAVANTVKELSRLKYGRDQAIVETEIVQRAALSEDVKPKGSGTGGARSSFMPSAFPSGPKLR